ncbi:MAG: transcriptional repressor [Cyanobacteria bacterium]|nr:transcriptional repressor [Cyanobacteriota bacterium]
MKSRRTRSQERLLQLLKQLNGEMSAQDLYVRLRELGQGMGLATVYRALEALRLEGVIQARTLGTGESLYSSTQKDRHHLNCIQCGRSLAIDDCPVHALEAQLSRSEGFQIFYHTLEFYGLCDRCQDGSPAPPQNHVHD